MSFILQIKKLKSTKEEWLSLRSPNKWHRRDMNLSLILDWGSFQYTCCMSAILEDIADYNNGKEHIVP